MGSRFGHELPTLRELEEGHSGPRKFFFCSNRLLPLRQAFLRTKQEQFRLRPLAPRLQSDESALLATFRIDRIVRITQ
jgi:hypothetical protein